MGVHAEIHKTAKKWAREKAGPIGAAAYPTGSGGRDGWTECCMGPRRNVVARSYVPLTPIYRCILAAIIIFSRQK